MSRDSGWTSAWCLLTDLTIYCWNQSQASCTSSLVTCSAWLPRILVFLKKQAGPGVFQVSWYMISSVLMNYKQYSLESIRVIDCFLLNSYFVIFIMCMFKSTCGYMWVHVQLPIESRRDCQIPWSCSYKVVRHPIWVLGAEPKSSMRVACPYPLSHLSSPLI